MLLPVNPSTPQVKLLYYRPPVKKRNT